MKRAAFTRSILVRVWELKSIRPPSRSNVPAGCDAPSLRWHRNHRRHGIPAFPTETSRPLPFSNVPQRGFVGGGRGQPGPACGLCPRSGQRRRYFRVVMVWLPVSLTSRTVGVPAGLVSSNISMRRQLMFPPLRARKRRITEGDGVSDRLSGSSGIAGPQRHVTQGSKVIPSDEYRLQSPPTRCRMGMFSLPEKLLAASDRKDVPGQELCPPASPEVQKCGRRQERRPPRHHRPFQTLHLPTASLMKRAV